MDFVERIYHANAAGLIFNLSPYLSSIPSEILEMGEDLDFPIFEMPAELHIIDISQAVCKAIITANDEQSRQERFLLDLIYDKVTVNEKKVNKAKELGYNPQKGYRIFSATYDSADEEQMHNIQALLTDEFLLHKRHIFSLIRNGRLVMMIPQETDPESHSPYGKTTDEDTTAQGILDIIHANYSALNFKIGIGSLFFSLSNVSESYEQSEKALNTLIQDPFAVRNYRSYSEMNFLTLMYEAKNTEVLNELYLRILGPLKVKDPSTEESMLRTLEIYIEESGNLSRSAERLYIHVNTLRYRLNKAEELLSCNIHNYKDLFHIYLALEIRRYLDSSD